MKTRHAIYFVPAALLVACGADDRNPVVANEDAGTGGTSGSSGGGSGGTSATGGNAGTGGSAGAPGGTGGDAGAAGGGPGGAGTGGTGACRAGDKDCDSDGTPLSCVAGGWVRGNECGASAPVCLDGGCVQCTPGTKACEDTRTPKTCTAHGAWMTQTDCVTGEVCANGICTDTVVHGGFVTAAPPTATGTVRLRSGGFHRFARSCAPSNGDCVVGGFLP
jgi:hypothetical protein